MCQTALSRFVGEERQTNTHPVIAAETANHRCIYEDSRGFVLGIFNRRIEVFLIDDTAKLVAINTANTHGTFKFTRHGGV